MDRVYTRLGFGRNDMRTMVIGVVVLLGVVLLAGSWCTGAVAKADPSVGRSIVAGRMLCSKECKARSDRARSVPSGVNRCEGCGKGIDAASRFCLECAKKRGVCEVCGRRLLPAAGGGDTVAREKAKLVVKGNNAFAFDLYGRLREKEGNLFLSPYSFSTALGMTYAGARGNTKTEMAKVLRFGMLDEQLHGSFGSLISDLNDRQKSKAYQLTVANALWLQKGYPFHDAFLALTKDHYEAGLENVDYSRATEAARQTINQWVERKTNDKIKDLIKPGMLNRLTRLVLTNAIYFKGSWAEEFDKKRTRERPFTMLNGKKGQVSMMSRTDRFKYGKGDGFQILELPYKEEELSMVVFLPDAVDGLAALEGKLNAENVEKWTKGMRKRRVYVGLPKFKMTVQFGLKDVLSSMGMIDAFLGNKADFSGMTNVERLFISAVIHKAYVDVNEEGTEAAAATAVVMEGGAMPAPLPVFRADHPFFFMIRDNLTGSVLFMGRLTKPGDDK